MIAIVNLALLLHAFPADMPATPLARAHAHNDYEHKRPLFDALEQGFRSVEADIWLTKGKLLVAHTPLDLKPERTLQSLYLDPLRERARANAGSIYPKRQPFYLMIDIKSESKSTYAELAKVLEQYADILTVTRGDKVEVKAVTIVISGNCDRDAIRNAATRHASIDGRQPDLDGDAPTTLIPWVSERWGAVIKWNGTGSMPEEEREKLRAFVKKAHAKKRMVRFWATPETQALWRELIAADVDLINTDKLAELRAFLLAEDRGR